MQTGEARSFVYPVIHHNLRQSVIDPLRADSFMVLSTTWTLTGNDPWPAQLGRLTSSDAMSDAVTAAVDVVDPVSSVVSDNAGLSTRAPRAWQHCFSRLIASRSRWAGVRYGKMGRAPA